MARTLPSEGQTVAADISYEPLPPDDPALKRLEQAALAKLATSGTPAVSARMDLPPISERVFEIAGGLLDNADGDRAIERHVLTLAVAAWNASLKPQGSRGEDYDAALRSLDARGLVRVLSGAAIELMIAVKEALYPDDCRRIVSWEVREQTDGVGLNVVSAFSV
jgi:hypothetical protein